MNDITNLGYYTKNMGFFMIDSCDIDLKGNVTFRIGKIVIDNNGQFLITDSNKKQYKKRKRKQNGI